MLVPYVLRLVATEAADGRIVGELETVRTGDVSTVHDVEELIALIRADQRRAPALAELPDGPPTAPGAA